MINVSCGQRRILHSDKFFPSRILVPELPPTILHLTLLLLLPLTSFPFHSFPLILFLLFLPLLLLPLLLLPLFTSFLFTPSFLLINLLFLSLLLLLLLLLPLLLLLFIFFALQILLLSPHSQPSTSFSLPPHSLHIPSFCHSNVSMATFCVS